MKEVIRVGDTTDHGGVVLEGFKHTKLNGKAVAGVGHRVRCRKCKGVYPIVEGSQTYRVDGVPVALDGMKTECGAKLEASGSRGAVHA